MTHREAASKPGAARVGRHVLRGAAAALSAVLLAACAQRGIEDGYSVSARQVFSVAIENLTDRYIEPIDAAGVTLAGLQRVAALDGNVAVRRVASDVRIEVGAELRAHHPAPAARDVYGWAWLAADIVDDVRRNSTAVAALANESLYEAMFEGVLAHVDRYSRYTSAAAARRNRAARDGFGGLGISIVQEGGATVVTQVHRDTPAARAGLKVDDRISHVDGVPLAGLPLDRVVRQLRGPVDSRVALRVERNGVAGPLELAIRRMHILLPTVRAARHGGVLEISLSGFNQGTARALRREIERAQREMGANLKGLILDLRGNPGGLLDQAVAVADLFLERGRIVSTKGRHAESNQIFDATPGALVRGLPMAVLINGRSASAAEIVAVALRDARRAVLVGTTTFGKGTVQTIARLPNGGEMTLTWARLFAPSGQTLDKQGIIPALCTGGTAESAQRLLKALGAAEQNGAALPAALVRAQAGAAHYSPEGHAACPPSTSETPADIEAARLAVASRTLYAQAVSETPAIAKHH